MSTSSPDPIMQGVDWVKNHLRYVVIGALVLFLVIGTLGFLSWKNKIHNEGFAKQRAVVTMYNNYQTALSTCLDQTNIAAQVASEQYVQIKNVLTAVVGARYSDEGALSSDGPIISALVEQYPQIGNELWQQLMTTALGCRSQVAGVNGQLQHVGATLDTWSHQGSWYAKPFRNNWPNDELKVVNITGATLTGREALDFILTPLTTGEAKQALLTHEMPSQDLFPDDNSSPTE